MSTQNSCFICQQEAYEKCDFCDNDVWFCCQEHFHLHRDPIVNSCYPYKILYQDGVGRYMMSTRDITAGEVIYSETPLIIGPNPVSAPQCLHCFKKISGEILCEGCTYPICGESICNQSNQFYHQKFECQIFKKIDNKQYFKIEGEAQYSNLVYEVILPIRLLLLRRTNPNAFAIANSFMDHLEDRKYSSDYWHHSSQTVIEPIFNATNGEFAIQDVSKAVGIIEINNYEIYNPDRLTGYRGLFPVTSIMSHSCLPNCRPIIKKKGTCVNTCIATVNIPKETELTINYVHLHLTTSERRKTLRDNWYFDCSCSRCQDPTEMNSFLSAIKCKRCDSHLLPVQSLDAESKWKCRGCENEENSNTVTSLIDNFKKEKDGINKFDLEGYFKFLEKALTELHPNHSILNSVRRWVIPLYCRQTSVDSTKIISPDMLKHKIELSHQFLLLLDITERGLTKNRGKTLFELADATLTYHNHFYQRGQLEANKLISRLDKCIRWLEESGQCLLFEDPISFEGIIFKSGKLLLQQIKDFKVLISSN